MADMPVKSPTASDFFRPFQLSTETTKATLGVGADHITPELLMEASKKILKVSKGESSEDDRDSLAYQRVYGPAEYLPEHIQRDGGRVARQLLWKATNRGNLDFIQAGALEPHTDAVFNDSGLSRYIDGSSAWESLDANTMITRIGEGGVGSQRMAPDSMRSVSNSYLGFIDPIRSPECYSPDTEVFTDNGWMSITDVSLSTKVACLIEGVLHYETPYKCVSYDYNGNLYRLDTRFSSIAVTDDHRMYVKNRTGVGYAIVQAKYLWGTPFTLQTSMNPREDSQEELVEPEKQKVVQYTGKVYCLSVPGGLLYVRRDGAQGFWCGNSLRVGLDQFLSKGTRKGSDGKLYTRLTNARTGKEEWVDSVTAAQSNVATAEYAPGGEFGDDPYVALPRGDKEVISYLPREKVDYFKTRSNEMFSEGANVVPMLSANKEMRTMMGCLHPDELLYIRRGEGRSGKVTAGEYLKTWQEGDMMLSIDENTHEGTLWREVQGVHKRPVTGKMYHLKVRGRNVHVTENHKWLVRRYGEYLLCETKDLMLYDHIPFIQSLSKRPIIFENNFVRWATLERYDICSEPKFVVDIDMGDYTYALANGLITHNSKYASQAVPLIHRQAPLVSTVDPDTGKSVEYLMGSRMGVRRASKRGVVKAVRKDRIDVEYDDHTKDSFELYDNFPANQKGFMYSTPLVKAGQAFDAGQVLAHTNYTDKEGNSALGVNLRVAYMPFRALNYEDAFLVSESAARNELASEQMYKKAIRLDKDIVNKKALYQDWKPGEYSKEQMAKLGDDGIVKVGQTIDPGDPVILGIRYEKPAPGKLGTRVLTDVSETWDHDEPGTVTDIAKTRSGVKVMVKVITPAQTGDKIAGRHGNKGVINCYDKDTEVLTEHGFKLFRDISPEDQLAVLDPNTGKAWFEAPLELYEKPYSGLMHGYESHTLNWLVTPNHSMVVLTDKEYEKQGMQTREHRVPADSIFNKRVYHRVVGNFTLPVSPYETVIKKGVFGTGRRTVLTFTLAELLVLYSLYGIPDIQGSSITLFIPPYAQYVAKTILPIQESEHPVFYTIEDRHIVRWIIEHSKTYGDYTLPEFLYSMSDYVSIALILIQELGLLSKRTLYNDIQRLVILSGMSVIPRNNTLEISLTTHRLSRADRGIYYTKEYNDFVYCARVSTGVLMVRRNGHNMWCGNCLPDELMPKDEHGVPFQIVENSLGTISRTNSAKHAEAAYGKLASKTGKPYTLPLFFKGDMMEDVDSALKKANLSDRETLTDPSTGRRIKDVQTGVGYFYKLKHLAESKMSSRGTGSYTAEDIPARGGMDGSKRLATMESTALLGHNATEVLKDAKLLRGSANSDFWRSIRTGDIPVMPGEPIVYKKFWDHLTASGIGVQRTPTGIKIFSMTNDDAKNLTGNRELKTTDTYDAKTLQPMDNGLFGRNIFGSSGEDWGYIQLDEPVPNPTMEDPMRRILNLTEKDFEAILSGSKSLNGMSGGAAIKNALDHIDLDKETENALKDLKTSSKSKKDAALKRYVALKQVQNTGAKLSDFMLDRVPVIPPAMRPITEAAGVTMVADSNHLYKQLLEYRDDVREAKDLPDEYKQEARANLYRAYKELVGLSEPASPALKQKNVKGLLRWALGKSTKMSAFNQKMLGTAVDTVGRGAVIGDPTLKLNEIGMPYVMAKELYKPFVVRDLVRADYSALDAEDMIDKGHPMALKYLKHQMESRPAIFNRAPTLHKLSIMAFKPVLRNGHALRTNPSINGPLGLDHDGDTGNVHVPVSRKAVEEAFQKMLPERNLIGLRKNKIAYPVEKDLAMGLFLASRGEAPGPRMRFNSVKDARAAYRRGDIDVDTPIEIG